MDRLTDQQQEILRNQNINGDFCLLELSDKDLVLSFLSMKNPQSVKTFEAISWPELLSKINHEPATDNDLEVAIATIEDEIIHIIPSFPNHKHLISFEPQFTAIAEAVGINPVPKEYAKLTTSDVEAIYQKLADIAYGAPISRYDLPVESNFTAACLFLRELMHHAGFEEISLYQLP